MAYFCVFLLALLHCLDHFRLKCSSSVKRFLKFKENMKASFLFRLYIKALKYETFLFSVGTRIRLRYKSSKAIAGLNVRLIVR